MRAFRNLECLAASHDVTLLIIPTGLQAKPPAAETSKLCGSIIVLPVGSWKNPLLVLRLVMFKLLGTWTWGRRQPFEFRSISPGRLRKAAALLAGKKFELIHVFRLYLHPYAFHLQRFSPGARIQLDLDDFESMVRRDQSELLRQTGRRKRSMYMQGEADSYERIERQWLGRFDRVFVCSEFDRHRLVKAYGDMAIEVLPNINVPTGDEPPGPATGVFIFLFIGTFSYFPNTDGLEFLCRQILPLLRNKSEKPFVIQVVGTGISRKLRLRFLFDRHIRFLGHVPQIETLYKGAGGALVPIRAGGGTRIKIIEAAAHQIPMISTSKGIEGLKFKPGVDTLIGDTPEEIAECCLALLEHEDLRVRLRTNALTVFQKYYRQKNLQPVLNKTAATIHPGNE